MKGRYSSRPIICSEQFGSPQQCLAQKECWKGGQNFPDVSIHFVQITTALHTSDADLHTREIKSLSALQAHLCEQEMTRLLIGSSSHFPVMPRVPEGDSCRSQIAGILVLMEMERTPNSSRHSCSGCAKHPLSCQWLVTPSIGEQCGG
jgi:hypothetical protein